MRKAFPTVISVPSCTQGHMNPDINAPTYACRQVHMHTATHAYRYTYMKIHTY